MEHCETKEFKGLDYGQAVEKFANELTQCKSFKEQRLAFFKGNHNLAIHYGKLKTSDLDVKILVDALTKKGIDYKKFYALSNKKNRETDEIGL